MATSRDNVPPAESNGDTQISPSSTVASKRDEVLAAHEAELSNEENDNTITTNAATKVIAVAAEGILEEKKQTEAEKTRTTQVDQQPLIPSADLQAASTPKGRKRGPVSSPSLRFRAKSEPQDDSASMPPTPSVADKEDEEKAEREEEETEPHKKKSTGKHDRTLPTAVGVSTRRSKSQQHQQQQPRVKQTQRRQQGQPGEAKEKGNGVNKYVRSNGNSVNNSSDDDQEVSAEPSQPTTASPTPLHDFSSSLASSTKQSSTPANFAASTRAKHDEILEAATHAAIQAQERQLRHTLLSIFPAHLRSVGAEQHTHDANNNSNSDGFSAPRGAGPQTSPLSLPQCNPEPLLPLLHALCEDKAYVYAAWCRYEDDIAVQRTQNSIQRKRQRHSFNRGMRKSTTTSESVLSLPTFAVAAPGGSKVRSGRNAVGGGVDDISDNGDETEADVEYQPPESEWVEAAPALTGPPRPFAVASLTPASSSSFSPTSHGMASNTLALFSVTPQASVDGVGAPEKEAFVASGFQWTPWQFYREKRRRSSSGRRAQGNVTPAGVTGSALMSAATAIGTPHTTTSVGNSGTAPVSSTTAAGDNTTNTNPSVGVAAPLVSGATTTDAAAVVTPAVGGGVPPLLFSEVPSLPVLQVDADVPEDPMAPVEAMTAEEQKSYARYVMSSGKLRNVCRDPYSFLVSRAKEMRIQWKRQHPFE